jgi:hypothetical protein
VRAADVAAFLFYVVEPSELQPRLTARFFRSHACGHEISDPVLKVESKFRLEMFLCDLPLEKSLLPAHGFILTSVCKWP